MKKSLIAVSVISLAFAITLTQSCHKDDSSNTPPPTPTLYDSLGGTAMVTDPTNSSAKVEQGYLTIRSIVDSAIFVIAADPQINVYFTVLLSEVTATPPNLTGFEALTTNVTTFFAIGTGAKDYTYTGKSMHDAHDPSTNSRITMKVQDDDFTEFELDVVAGAVKCGVPATDPRVASLGKIMESLRTSVVNQ